MNTRARLEEFHSYPPTTIEDAFWTYRATTDPWSRYDRGAVDGDTIDLLVDQGLRDFSRARVRLMGLNTAERFGVSHESAEYERAMEQTRFVRDWFDTAWDEWDDEWPLVVSTEDDNTGKYGRLVAVISRRSDGQSLNRAIQDEWPETSDTT